MPPPNVSLGGRVIRHHRMQGHYVEAGEPVLDVLLADIHVLTFRASEAGKILQIAAVGAVVGPSAHVVEITTVGTPRGNCSSRIAKRTRPRMRGESGSASSLALSEGQVFKDVESLKRWHHFRRRFDLLRVSVES
jgi:hypothetical protein